MTNQSIVETVNAFIEDINACNSDVEIDALLASRDLRVHGLHTLYNLLQDVEKADKLIDEAAQNRRTVLAQGGEIKEGDVVKVVDNIYCHKFDIGSLVTISMVDKIQEAYLCEQQGRQAWWLRSDEFKKVN